MNILAVDVGGTHVKILASGETEPRRFASGPKMTPDAMVSQVKALAGDWKFDAATIGYPGPVKDGLIIGEPHNLAPGWVGFDFTATFGCPVKLINDAAMQALGSYKGGKMLFLGLGTGLGTTLIVDNIILPMELGHLPYKRGTFEDYIGERGLDRMGKRKWRARVDDVTARLIRAVMPDDVVRCGGSPAAVAVAIGGASTVEGAPASMGASASIGGASASMRVPASIGGASASIGASSATSASAGVGDSISRRGTPADISTAASSLAVTYSSKRALTISATVRAWRCVPFRLRTHAACVPGRGSMRVRGMSLRSKNAVRRSSSSPVFCWHASLESAVRLFRNLTLALILS